MVITVSDLNIDSFREVLADLITIQKRNIKRIIKKRSINSSIFLVLSILSFSLQRFSSDWYYLGLLFLSLAIIYLIRIIIIWFRNSKHIQTEKTKWEKWFLELKEVHKWVLKFEDKIYVLSDNEESILEYESFTDYILNENYIFLINKDEELKSFLLPRKSISDLEYDEAKTIIIEKMDLPKE